MNSPQPSLGSAAPHGSWTRRLVNVLVALVVIAVAGATFVFSYAGVHAIALLGGVSAQLARYYPGLFDAVLVIACVCAVVLRGGRLWARLWAWLVLIIILGGIGTTDVLHAMDYTLRHRVTEGIVAAAPVVAVLLAFSLLLTLLRQSRPPAPAEPVPAPLDVPALPAAVSLSPIALPAAPVAFSAVAGTDPLEREETGTEPIATAAAPAGPPAAAAVPTAAVPVEPPAGPVPGQPMPPDAALAAPAAEVAEKPAFTEEAEPSERAEPPGETTRAERSPEAPKDAAVARAAAVPDGNAVPDASLEDAASGEAQPATGPSEVTTATEDSSAMADEPVPPTGPVPPAAPTVEVPAVTAPTTTTPPERSRGIRYAGSGPRDTPPAPDYWDADDTQQFAGLVYRARDDDDEGQGAPVNGPSARPNQPELDDDAPPFATAPFAPMPRLNRVRSTPIPPVDEDEDV